MTGTPLRAYLGLVLVGVFVIGILFPQPAAAGEVVSATKPSLPHGSKTVGVSDTPDAQECGSRSLAWHLIGFGLDNAFLNAGGYELSRSLSGLKRRVLERRHVDLHSGRQLISKKYSTSDFRDARVGSSGIDACIHRADAVRVGIGRLFKRMDDDFGAVGGHELLPSEMVLPVRVVLSFSREPYRGTPQEQGEQREQHGKYRKDFFVTLMHKFAYACDPGLIKSARDDRESGRITGLLLLAGVFAMIAYAPPKRRRNKETYADKESGEKEEKPWR